MSTAGATLDRLDAPIASLLAQRALASVARAYPYHAGHVQQAPDDVHPARALHPAFWGSYDWHSCVHMHWTLVRLRRLQPRLPERVAITQSLDARLNAPDLAAEADYFHRPATQSFERTYGWAWLLALAGEVHASGDAPSSRWSRALAPLVDVIVARYLAFLPRARYPIRHGVHANSAFGLALALDYARQARAGPLAELVTAKALEWFAADRDLPIQWEPSGADFLSPALMEADLMRRVLAPGDFAAWLAGALPALDGSRREPACVPVEVSDRSDPQIVHLDGLNLSRAWCLRGIAGALPARDRRRESLLAAARRHVDAGLEGVASTDYAGAHWLATFAVLALTAA